MVVAIAELLWSRRSVIERVARIVGLKRSGAARCWLQQNERLFLVVV